MPDLSDNELLHDAVTEAFNEVEKASADETTAVPVPGETPEEPVELEEPEDEEAEGEEAPADEAPAPGERGRDPKTGKFVPRKERETAPGKAQAAKPTEQASANRQTPQARPQARPTVPADPLSRAPQAWRALARERWAALDKLGEEGKAIKEEVLRREREVNITLQKTAEQRAFSEEFQKIMAPFAPIIAANGHTPLQSVQGLMQTAAALQMGPPGQKALIAATIIRQYGIDIDMLAQVLETGGLNPQAVPLGQGYDPRVDRLLADQQRAAYEAQQRAAQMEARQMAELQRNYDEFGETHEFFSDDRVRQAMADIIELKEKQGVDIQDEEAYDIAVNLFPDIVAVQRERDELAQATNPNGSTARAAAASVSLKPGTTLSTPKPSDPNDLHAVVSESWDEVYGGRR